jgi:hypothetical protein
MDDEIRHDGWRLSCALCAILRQEPWVWLKWQEPDRYLLQRLLLDRVQVSRTT